MEWHGWRSMKWRKFYIFWCNQSLAKFSSSLHLYHTCTLLYATFPLICCLYKRLFLKFNFIAGHSQWPNEYISLEFSKNKGVLHKGFVFRVDYLCKSVIFYENWLFCKWAKIWTVLCPKYCATVKLFSSHLSLLLSGNDKNDEFIPYESHVMLSIYAIFCKNTK